jgi:hypothetical protein
MLLRSEIMLKDRSSDVSEGTSGRPSIDTMRFAETSKVSRNNKWDSSGRSKEDRRFEERSRSTKVWSDGKPRRFARLLK